jgi:predicted metal-dependent HD superfamily phosphohydrolase
MGEGRETLQQLWLRYVKGLGITSQSMPLLTRLIQSWSEPSRHYHTLRHLQECLLLLERWCVHSPFHHHVGMALWFHDAIYDATRHNNEERSARWAYSALKGLDADPDDCRRIARLIRATRHDGGAHEGDDIDLMLDIDLAILGAERARFEEYERQVRLEYAHVDDAAFARGRARFVDSMLSRDRIFRTESAHTELAAQARANLKRSADRWRAASG